MVVSLPVLFSLLPIISQFSARAKFKVFVCSCISVVLAFKTCLLALEKYSRVSPCGADLTPKISLAFTSIRLLRRKAEGLFLDNNAN